MVDDTENAYSVIWKYKVKSKNIKKFEREYGSAGTWFELFSKSKEYRGSLLHRSEDEINSYLLIDTWSSKEAYENFKETNERAYLELSTKFEDLYEKEEKIGAYNFVTP